MYHVQESGHYSQSHGIPLVVPLLDVSFLEIALRKEWRMDLKDHKTRGRNQLEQSII